MCSLLYILFLLQVNRPSPKDVVPHTPQILDDLMAVESLLAEDDEEQACCEGKFAEDDPNLFASLLHLADHCLYKIVRWARNLPDFPSVSVSCYFYFCFLEFCVVL